MGGFPLKKIVVRLIFSALIFCLSLWILYSKNLQNFKEKIQIVRNTLYAGTEFVARVFHLEFQQNSIYEASLNNDEANLKTVFSTIKENYPIVAKIYMENLDEAELVWAKQYTIVFQDGIRLLFRIRDLTLSDYFSNKALAVLIDVEKLFQALGITDIMISEEGKFTILGDIKCDPKESLLSLNGFVISVAFSVLAVLLFELTFAIRKIKSEHALSDELLKKTVFQQTLLEFTRLVLNDQIGEAFQYILEKAVKLVPVAQAGRLLVKENDVFVLKNVCGYDQKIVENMFFKPTELARGLDGGVRIITKLYEINDEFLDAERKNLLYSEGNVEKIKVTLSIPVTVNDEIIAFFNLDNFQKEDAFTEESTRTAELFASQVSLLFERIRLDKELEKQKRAIEYYSYHDPLTGLANRRLLEEFAEKVFAHAERTNRSLCVLFMDLHKFKQVNDTFGHAVGDQLLRLIALRIKDTVRENDIVARLGGDEFVFLLDLSINEVSTFIERLLRKIQESVVVENKRFTISANFGIAFYPQDGDNLETLLRCADMALYSAKRRDEPFVFYTQLSKKEM